MINWHSERFKKVMIWVMALVLLPMFLFGAYELRTLIGLGGPPKQGLEEVRLNGEKADKNEYLAFIQRWQMAMRGESDAVHQQWGVNPSALTEAVYINSFYPYMPVQAFINDEGRPVDSNRLQRLMESYLDNFYCRYKEAEGLGILISDDRINSEIENSPPFQSKDPATGKSSFNEVLYTQYLSQWGMTEGAYRQFLRERMMIAQMEQIYLGPGYLGNTVVSPLDMAEKYAAEKEQRRVRQLKVTLASFMADARKNVQQRVDSGLLALGDEELKNFYNDPKNFGRFATPRRIKGDCLRIDMAKLGEAAKVNSEEIEKDVRKEIETEKEKNISALLTKYARFYDENKDRLYRKPHEGTGPSGETEPGAGGPGAGEPEAGEPGGTPSPKDAEYFTYSEIEDRVREDYAKDMAEKAVKEKHDEEIRKRLNDIYKALEEHVNAHNAVDARGAAQYVFRGVSMGNLLEKLGAFLKVTMADARRREGAADLKTFAGGYEYIEYIPEGEFFSKDDAKDAPKIGGGELARLATDRDPQETPPTGRYVDASKYAFAEEKLKTPEERLVCKGGLSGILKPGAGDDRFVFRILDVQERILVAFEALDEAAKKTVREALIANEAGEDAYKLLYKCQERITMQAKEILQDPQQERFDFELEAQLLAEGRKKNLSAAGDGAGANTPEDPAFGIAVTEYLTRGSEKVEGIPETDVSDFIDAAFRLKPAGREPAIVHGISALEDLKKQRPEGVDEKKDFFYIIMLAGQKDNPIRRPARERFVKDLGPIVFNAMLQPVQINQWAWDKDATLQEIIRTTRHVQGERQKRFDDVAARITKKIYKPEKKNHGK